jgi:hypothetical protein
MIQEAVVQPLSGDGAGTLIAEVDEVNGTGGGVEKGIDSSFRSSIQAFITGFKRNPPGRYEISVIRELYRFQKRRLYDVINVLVAIGCCSKALPEAIEWHGLEKVPETVAKLRQSVRMVKGKADLYSIIPAGRAICISTFTAALIQCFVAQNKQVLNIKRLGSLLSRRNGRTRTTLCKLYQICYILEAIGVIERLLVAGEIRLRDEYFVSRAVAAPRFEPSPQYMFSIKALLV